MRIIAFSNQKGGVGKSTSCINIAAALGMVNKSSLVIDMDPQGNTTTGLGINETDSIKTVYDCLTDELPLKEAIISTKFKGVDIVPADITLANAELEIASVMGRESLLKDSIALEIPDYDYIFIDLPPNLGLLTINGLVAADEVIIPVDVSIFAISGVAQLIKVINMVRKKLNPRLCITGALLTKVDARTNLSREIHQTMQEYFGNRLFKNVIHQNIKIAEAQKEQMPVSYYDPKCKGAEEYSEVAKEVLEGIK